MNMSNPFPVDTYLPYMRDVSACERSLHELNLMWRMIESSAKMNCPLEARAILPTMAATRAGFGALEGELVASLVREKTNNVLGELSTKARYAIDIVVRNLYERTADVGFLATDAELCAFAAGLSADAGALRLRLRAYRDKYTVYDEIIVLDTQGNVLVQIDENSPLEGSVDALIGLTLASDDYVETFRASDLRPGKREALIYSRRLLHPDSGAVVGVLCLCFAFEEEMARIFQTHRDPMERSNMLLLDADNRVIASADPLWIPCGARVPVNRSGQALPMMHAGREYLVRTHGSAGYQAYPGPAGWQGQVMVPLDVAFGAASGNVLAELHPGMADGLLAHARSFCPPLYDIMRAAETVRRVVWNGQVMSAGQEGDMARLNAILGQISETGARSNELFAQSIRALFDTVLASGRREAEFLSHLLVDLLDRNLYERANDCRWWALSPELRALLAQPHGQPGRAARIAAILDYINGLYTVYAGIFVYDSSGAIVAGSGQCGSGAVDADTLGQVLALRGEQAYYVTPFQPSPMYGGAPTFIYHAAIRHPQQGSQVLGGIGIVFDAGAEFAAMLNGGLAGRADVDALFLERSGRVLASTDASRPAGSLLALDADLLALACGASASRMAVHDGQYAIMACTASHGYREFKVADGYQCDVIAVVIERFGQVSESQPNREIALLDSAGSAADGAEFATFIIDGVLFAMAARGVQQALPAATVAPVSMGGCDERLGLIAAGEAGEFVWVFDLGYLLAGRRTAVDAASQVVIVRHGGRAIGLLVSELHGVARFGPGQIVDAPLAGAPGAALVRQLIKANGGDLLIQVVDNDYLFMVLQEPAA